MEFSRRLEEEKNELQVGLLKLQEGFKRMDEQRQESFDAAEKRRDQEMDDLKTDMRNLMTGMEKKLADVLQQVSSDLKDGLEELREENSHRIIEERKTRQEEWQELKMSQNHSDEEMARLLAVVKSLEAVVKSLESERQCCMDRKARGIEALYDRSVVDLRSEVHFLCCFLWFEGMFAHAMKCSAV